MTLDILYKYDSTSTLANINLLLSICDLYLIKLPKKAVNQMEFIASSVHTPCTSKIDLIALEIGIYDFCLG